MIRVSWKKVLKNWPKGGSIEDIESRLMAAGALEPDYVRDVGEPDDEESDDTWKDFTMDTNSYMIQAETSPATKERVFELLADGEHSPNVRFKNKRAIAKLLPRWKI